MIDKIDDLLERACENQSPVCALSELLKNQITVRDLFAAAFIMRGDDIKVAFDCASKMMKERNRQK